MKQIFAVNVPGGGDDDGTGIACNSRMRFVKLLSLFCTRRDGHQGEHQAGVDDGMMCARWDDDRSTDS